MVSSDDNLPKSVSNIGHDVIDWFRTYIPFSHFVNSFEFVFAVMNVHTEYLVSFSQQFFLPLEQQSSGNDNQRRAGVVLFGWLIDGHRSYHLNRLACLESVLALLGVNSNAYLNPCHRCTKAFNDGLHFVINNLLTLKSPLCALYYVPG